jgi:hypothetical protein
MQQNGLLLNVFGLVPCLVIILSPNFFFLIQIIFKIIFFIISLDYLNIL